MKIVPKYKDGDYIAESDKTSTPKPEIHEHIKFIQKPIEAEQAQLYDKDKVDFYRDLQNFYNYNAFGYGISGNQTRLNPATQQDQIRSNFEYARGNAKNFGANIIQVAVPGAVLKSIAWANRRFPILRLSITENLGTLGRYMKSNVIGQGAEAVVIEDSPLTVGKITSIPVEEMTTRNAIPNVAPSKYVGYVYDDGFRLPTYIQRKLKVLNKDTFSKYITKLDNSMKKHGFTVVRDPQVQYRAYTNGNIVIDDIAPENIGLDFFRKPKILDLSVQTIPEWLELGYTLP